MNKAQDTSDDKPPILKSWRNMYLLVIINLALTVALFYFITVYFK